MQIKLHANDGTRNGDCARCESAIQSGIMQESYRTASKFTNTETEYNWRANASFRSIFIHFLPLSVYHRGFGVWTEQCNRRDHMRQQLCHPFYAIDHCLFLVFDRWMWSQRRNGFKSNHNLCLPEHEHTKWKMMWRQDYWSSLYAVPVKNRMDVMKSENKSPQTLAQKSCPASAAQLFYYFHFSTYLFRNTKNERTVRFIFIYMYGTWMPIPVPIRLNFSGFLLHRHWLIHCLLVTKEKEI